MLQLSAYMAWKRTQHKAPGKYYRNGIRLIDLMRMFPDDATAEQWFVEGRWPTGVQLSVLPQRPSHPLHAQDHAVRLPELPHVLFGQDGHGNTRLHGRLPEMGHRHLPDDHADQGHLKHEHAPRDRRHPRRRRGICATGCSHAATGAHQAVLAEFYR